MHNYFETAQNLRGKSQIKSAHGLVHSYKQLPTASPMRLHDISRRNSLPKYDTNWTNNACTTEMRYELLFGTKNHYNNQSVSPVKKLTNINIKNNNCNNNNNHNNNNNDNNYNNYDEKLLYNQFMLKQQQQQEQEIEMQKKLQQQQQHQQELSGYALSKVEKRRIQDRVSYAAFNQHYQHYYTYYYKNPEDISARNLQQQSPPTLRTRYTRKHQRVRNNMATATTYDFPDLAAAAAASPQRKPAAHALDNRNTALMAGVHKKQQQQQQQQRQHSHEHVLKEKNPNNNVIVTINHNDWLIDRSDRTRVLNLTRNPYDLCAADDNLNDKNTTTRKQRPHAAAAAAESAHETTIENGRDAYGLAGINLNPTNKRQQHTTKPRFVPPRVSAFNAKHNSPNRRVLVYSCPSPRARRQSPAIVSAGRARQLERELAGSERIAARAPALSLKERLLKTSFSDDIAVIDVPDDNNNNDDDDVFSDITASDEDDASDVNAEDISAVSSDSDDDGYRTHAFKMTNAMLRVTATPSNLSQQITEDVQTPDALLAPSLFPHVPPYISFSGHLKCGPYVPPELQRILKWRVTNVMPKVVRNILANSGMRLLKKTNDWMGTWGKHMKSPCFKTLRPYQKLNHLPGSFRIGRKDSCWKNLQKLTFKHSKKEFGFMPKTYIIPQDLPALRKSWPRYSSRNVKWIIKPPASARGAGIRVVNKWAQIPKRRPLIVQKYIERPLLIHGSKFDLRLYVLVTSINPMRVYMYHNGLARFASVKYSDKSETLNDRCMHLTNYSINKISTNYLKNEDVNACQGHKWTIKSLWTYLSQRGVRTDLLWDALRSLVLRTLLAGESSMNNMIKLNVESKYSVFELFGFDILLDADLIPWLLEVNISPSLHSELPLDAHVKAPLVQAVLNTALYHVPPKLSLERQKEIAAAISYPTAPFCYDKRLYINYLSRDEKIKHLHFTRKGLEERENYLDTILNNLTPDDVRCLIIAEDELARCAPLERIFPTSQTYRYLRFTDSARYYNRLLDAWEARYSNNRGEGIALLRRFCEQKYHLEVPPTPAKKASNAGDETSSEHHPSVEQPAQVEISSADS